MNNEWRTAKLSAVAETIISNVDKKTKPNEHPVLLCNYTDVYRNSFILADMDFMSATATKREIAKCSLNEDDVIITKDSEKYDDIGVPALVRENVPDLVCGYHLVILRPAISEIDGAYLFYALSAKEAQQQFHSYANGMTRFGLRKGDIGLVEIQLPPLPAQRAISRVLGAFDDKIALNSRMNATLEAMARALFRAWFVDFEPVRAKQAGHWRRGQTLPGMPAELYDAFPAELTATELGEVPVGWQARALGDELAALVSGSRPRGGAVSSGVPSIGAENVLGLGRYDFSKEKYVPPDFFDRLKRKGADVRNGDVLLYKDGAKIGRKTYFDKGFPHADCAVNEHAFILRLRNAAAQRYLYFWLGQDWMTHKIITLNSNTAQPGINQAGVRSLPILMPTDDALSAFDDIVSDMTGRIFANCHESRNLAAMRDTLLPRLLSGEVRVE